MLTDGVQQLLLMFFRFVTYNKEDSLEFVHYSSDLSCLGQARDHHKLPDQ